MEGSDIRRAVRRGLPDRIEALLYDFDDTIVESERMNESLFTEVLSGDFGVELSPEDKDSLYGLSWTGVFDWLRDNNRLSASRAAVWDRFLEEKGRLLSSRRLRVATGIERMFALPARQAIVSGSTRGEVRAMMENIGMRPDVVGLIICDEDCRKGKPDPEGFRLALERLGVSVGSTVVFEDSPPGLQAARAAGITAVFIAELALRDNCGEADICYSDFGEAWEAMRGRIRGARG